MSTASVAQHTASELVFRTLDESGELAYFLSESKSKQGKRNVTALDTVNGEVYCFCRAAELNKECWHCQLVRESWLAHVAAETVARATTLAEVEAIGRAAKARIAAWGALTVLVSPLDRAVYTEARRVYARLLRAEQPVAAEAVAAPLTVAEAAVVVAEWEGLSYSDRHIDIHVDGRRGERAYRVAQDALISQRAA